MKGKTEFAFQTNLSSQQLNSIVQNFLIACGYKQFETTGHTHTLCYVLSDMMMGNKYLEYHIMHPGTIIIYAYLHSRQKPMPLDDAITGSLAKSSARNHIQPLLNELSNYSYASNTKHVYVTNSKAQPRECENANMFACYNIPCDNTGAYETQPLTGQSFYPNPTAVYKHDFAGEVNKRNGNMAVIGFILSLFMVLTSALGIVYGGILILVSFYLGITGLKSDKKWFAVAAIILSCISALVLVISISLTVMRTF